MHSLIAAIYFIFLLSIVYAQDDPFSCSPSKPCAIGCCGKNGVCSFGPSSCAPEKCESNCDRKSECDPGWGAKWSQREKCPLNVCCSKFGFCGTTPEFCGSKTVKAPSCSGTSANKRVVGYYEGWSISRKCDTMYPEAIPASAYTHLNFAFAFIDPNSFAVAPMSETDKSLYKRFTGLKDTNPGLQTWIAVGGWSMNDPDQPTKDTFSNLAASNDAQAKFFKSLLSFMATYGFDGVDIDWEYPVAPERSGKPEDFTNLVSFLANLKKALGSSGHTYGLSITLPSSYWYLQHFDIVEIAKHINFFNMMTYDLHGTWDSTNKYIGPVVNAHTNLTEIDLTMDLLWRNNIEPEKVNLGLGFYGRSFTLTNPSCTSPGCGFSGGAEPGSCTANAGTLGYAEIERIIAGGAKMKLDKKAAVQQVVWKSNQWISYDDAETFKMKIDYANKKCLGGIMVWAVSTDDAEGSAAAALSKSTGRQIVAALALNSQAANSISQCVWGECDKACPPGTSAAQRGDKGGKGNAGLYNGCSGPITGGSSRSSRPYCCPQNDVPLCEWRGTAPFCHGRCHDDEVEVSSDTAGTGSYCFTGHKVLCCKSTKSDETIGKCKWYGAAPICTIFSWQHYGCPKGQDELTYSKYGSGGESGCHPFAGYKSFCCGKPPPYTGCDWYYHGNKFWGAVPSFCGGGCPNGKYPIASDPYLCITGAGLFCCDSPKSDLDPAQSTVHNLLNAFNNDPTCKSGNRAFSKRNANAALLEQRQDTKLSTQQQRTLISALSVMAIALRGRSGSKVQSSIKADFEKTLGPNLHLDAQGLVDQLDLFPNSDPNYLTESLVCQGASAGDYLKAQKRTRDKNCYPEDPRTSLKKRTIQQGWNYIDGPDQEPSVATMLFGVIDTPTLLEYLYTRLIRFRGQNEGIIEVAWRIPTGTGTGSHNPGVYRGPDNDPPDNYFVVHLHVDHMYYDSNDGSRWPGVYTVQAFHGQYIPTGRYRVDGNSQTAQGRAGRNDRTDVLECTLDNNGDRDHFYPGWNVDQNDPLSRFGGVLRQRGYVDGTTLDLVGGNGPPNGIYVPLNWGNLQPNGESSSFTPGGTEWRNPHNYPKE